MKLARSGLVRGGLLVALLAWCTCGRVGYEPESLVASGGGESGNDGGVSSGGVGNAGGAKGSGGVVSSGGVVGSGGVIGSGGVNDDGGTNGSGGQSGAAGAVGSGGEGGGAGATGTGGAAGGRAGTGGTGGVGTGGVGTGGVGGGGATGKGGTGNGGTSGGGKGGGAGGGAGGAGHGGGAGGGGKGGSGVGGSAGGNFGTPATIDCSSPDVPPSGLFSDFNVQPVASGRWASSNGLVGSVFSFTGDTSMASATVGNAPGDLHLTASVIANSYVGGGIQFDSCLSTGTYTNIRFSVSGTTNCPTWLQLETYDTKPTSDVPPGGCTSTCKNYPTIQNISLSQSTVTVPLSSFSPWSSTLSTQVVGVYWLLTTLNNLPACTADLHFDNITLVP